VLVERGDVPWDTGVDRRQELRDLRQLGLGVVEAGNDERHDLRPDAALLQPLDRVEYRLQYAAEIAVVAVVESLEVDLVQIDVRRDVVENLRRAVAVRHVRTDQALFLRFLENFDGPLRGDERLVVGRGDDLRAMLLRQADEIERLDV